jgi:KipI family sensor histidine kinase inhibitor
VLLHFDPLELAPARAEGAALELARSVGAAAQGSSRFVEVPTVYDGPDLGETAARSGLSVPELVEAHAGREYRAFFVGFMPGFAYCGPLDERIVAPRLERPRERVPAGSVAVADGQTGIYPLDSAGGWRLIGRTSLRCFDPERDPPVLVRAGDRVRFVPR